MCIYRAVDRKTHKVEETGLCTERRSVCIANLGAETSRTARKERGALLDIYTVNRREGRLLLYTLRFEFGWYLSTSGMVLLW